MSTQESTSDTGPLPESTHNGNGALTTIENRLPTTTTAVAWAQSPPPRPEILSSKPNPVELLHALRRRWPVAIGLGLLVSGLLAGVLWFFMPVQYEAFRLLQVASQPPAVLDKQSSGIEEFNTFKRTQQQLIQSNQVIQQTLAERTVAGLSVVKEQSADPVSWLRGKLIVDYPDDATILRVAIKTKNKDDSLKIVDIVVKKFLSEIVDFERNERDKRERKLKATYDKFSDDCKKQEEILVGMKKLHNSSSTQAAKVRLQMESAKLSHKTSECARLRNELTNNAMHVMLLEARRDNPSETAPSEAAVELELSRDHIVSQASEHLRVLQDQLHVVIGRTKNPESSRPIKSLNQQIQRAEETIDERKNSLRGLILQQFAEAPMGNSQQLSLPLLLQQKKFLETQYNTAEDELSKQAEILKGLEDFNGAVVAKEEDLHALKKITLELRGVLDRLGVERLADDRIKTFGDEASLTNSSGDAMRKYIAVAFAAILGLSLTLLGVAVTEFQSRKVNSVNEVNDGLGIRVIGELPNVSGRTWRRIKGGKGPAVLKALMAERIDGTRTNLIHTTTIKPPRAVMVTSAEPHEGKTTTSTQLAASLARSGRRTLLIDADIRNPGAHRVFDMPMEPGLCELLRGEAERDAVIHPTRAANLWLIPGGHCDLKSVQALSTSYLGSTITALCGQFDYVVIESGPVLKVADALMVGQHVDAAIVSVLRDVSKVPSVYEACERLRSVGIVVLGAVVNGVKDDAARHGVELMMAEATAAK